MPLAFYVRPEADQQKRHEEAHPGDIRDPNRWSDAEDVEEPDSDDAADADEVGGGDVDNTVVEDRLSSGWEPLRYDEETDQVAEDREHDRPADPVPEGADRTGERET